MLDREAFDSDADYFDYLVLISSDSSDLPLSVFDPERLYCSFDNVFVDDFGE